MSNRLNSFMRKFISIVENTIRPRGDTRPTKTVDVDKTMDVAPAVDTHNALARGYADNPELTTDMVAAAPNILRDLENIKSTLPAEELEKYDQPIDGVAVGYEEPRTPENLPMVLTQELEGMDGFDPRWHQVRNLPGMLQQGIRMVGRMFFGEMTTIDTSDIQMMTNAMGLNPEVDVRKMFSLIKQNGTKLEDITFDFSETMPAYAAIGGVAEGQIWRAIGYEFFIMRDNGGHYVYAWPEDTSKRAGKIASHQGNTPMLGDDTV